MLLVLTGLFAFQLWRGWITRDALSYIVTLIFFCVMVLWFQKQPQSASLLTENAPSMVARAWLVAGALFLLAGAAVYVLLPTPQPDATLLEVITVVFGAFGLGWLPAVCVVLGVRAYRYNSRTGKSL